MGARRERALVCSGECLLTGFVQRIVVQGHLLDVFSEHLQMLVDLTNLVFPDVHQTAPQ